MPNNRIKSPSPDPILKFAPTDELKVARLAHLNAAKKEIKERLDNEFQKKGYSSVILGLKQTGVNSLVLTDLYNPDEIPYESSKHGIGSYRITFSPANPILLDNTSITESESHKRVTLFYDGDIIGYITISILALSRVEIRCFDETDTAVEMNTLFAANASDYDFILQEIKILP